MTSITREGLAQDQAGKTVRITERYRFDELDEMHARIVADEADQAAREDIPAMLDDFEAWALRLLAKRSLRPAEDEKLPAFLTRIRNQVEIRGKEYFIVAFLLEVIAARVALAKTDLPAACGCFLRLGRLSKDIEFRPEVLARADSGHRQSQGLREGRKARNEASKKEAAKWRAIAVAIAEASDLTGGNLDAHVMAELKNRDIVKGLEAVRKAIAPVKRRRKKAGTAR